MLLLAAIIGLFAVLIQGASLTRTQIESLEANVRTAIELREAGAFGTGGFGADQPVGAQDFSVTTLEMAGRIPHAAHIVRFEEYVHTPQIDASRPNAYAMIIGLRPSAPMRAIGEVDYENARIIAGRGLDKKDADRNVAVVGRLYARERLGIEIVASTFAESTLTIGGAALRVVGVYSTGNDFGDNHVFIPIDSFRRIFKPGGKLSKIRVIVDSVANVEAVVADLRRLPGVDAVTAAEQVATAKAALASMAAATFYGSLLLFSIGGVLIVFVMAMAVQERIREIGTLKAIGASNGEIAKQFLAESFAMVMLAGIGAVVVAAVAVRILEATLGPALALGGKVPLFIVIGVFAFAALGGLYPIVKGIRLSPVEAMKNR
ncbi:MAG: ABC transporter permease [Rhizobiales bacterium]|nr:ABC transporter permease [Hyphomicrobiales bacterium]